MPERGAGDSLSFFLLIAGYLLLAIATLLILRVVVFDFWLGTAPPPNLFSPLLGLPVIPIAMIIAGHAMRHKGPTTKSENSESSGQ